MFFTGNWFGEFDFKLSKKFPVTRRTVFQIDVELFNWRGVFAPPGVNATQRQAMLTMVEKMAATPQWAEACKTRDWTMITLGGDQYKTFLDAETARIEGILKELGLG